jgi:hydrogenase maturation protein HypF
VTEATSLLTIQHLLGSSPRAMESLMSHRYSIQFRGLVQRVGFRPIVDRLAAYLRLQGMVKAFVDPILPEVGGEGAFLETARDGAGPKSRLGTNRHEPADSGFVDDDLARIGPDLGICVDCLVELFDPNDRRSRDPFMACGNCGPRWSIGEAASIGLAPACPECRAEFEDPANRRFRLDSITCPDCEPKLKVEGLETSTLDPIGATVNALRDARSKTAVSRLRGRKRADQRPLAIMVANLAAVRAICEVSDDEAALLTSRQRPIVILKKRQGPSIIAEAVAGSSPWLGVKLPDSALQHLILRELRGVPLVMTGGHSSGVPIAFDDPGSRRWLKTLADFFLDHDQPILIRSDDSVTRSSAGVEMIVRRSRGHVPEVVGLPRECPVPTLALGGQQQATFALGQGFQGVLSHHLSDLRNLEAYRAFEKAIDHFEARFGFEPELIAHDFDPDDASSFHASRRGIETVPVQHHHAHVASCMAENGLDETVIGVVLDGNGLGGDGSLWGGEFLVASFDGFRRAGQFRSVPMPGRAAAILEPWRMALSYLDDAREDLDLMGRRVRRFERRRVENLLKKRIDAPRTSSAARLFDAVAVLAGLRRDAAHEGQAANEMEWRSSEVEADHAYPFKLTTAEDRPRLIVDTRPLIAAIADDVRRGVEPGRIGRRFHSMMVEAIARVCDRIRAKDGLSVVALTGSVFNNRLLLEETIARLTRDGFEVHHHRRVPTDDGGLSLGQLAIAAAWSARQRELAIEEPTEVIA